jgi:hypothetical protein
MASRDEDHPEREKLSWREIDQRRDGSRHVSRGERPAARPGTSRAQRAERLRQQALKEAHKVFEGKQGTPEHQKAVQELHRHFGTKKFLTLARQYLKEYGKPRDWGLLFLMLDLPDPEAVGSFLEQMAALFPSRTLREQQAFLSKLRTLAALAEDSAVQETAEELLERLRPE